MHWSYQYVLLGFTSNILVFCSRPNTRLSAYFPWPLYHYFWGDIGRGNTGMPSPCKRTIKPMLPHVCGLYLRAWWSPKETVWTITSAEHFPTMRCRHSRARFVSFIVDKSQSRSDICGNCPLRSLDGWWPSSTPFSKTMRRGRHTFLLDSYTAIIENRPLCAITTIKLAKKWKWGCTKSFLP
jgi:hypothetical protein